jgi:TetR/AcrR family transcriptional repressor of bet genes
MPKRVDHEERRAHITQACRSVIADEGLSAATFERIAAQASYSIRLLQYYFGSKAAMLQATRDAVLREAGVRFQTLLDALDPEATTATRVVSLLLDQLPVDAERLRDARVLQEFHAQSARTQRVGVADPSVGGSSEATDALRDVVLAVSGEEATSDAADRADAAVALTGGLVQGVLAGNYDTARAARILHVTCSRLFDD